MQAKTKVGSLHDILASRTRMEFRYRVDFDEAPLQNLDEMTLWCKENCKGLWRREQYYAIYFQFDDDYDATMFMLRWGGASGNKLK